MGAGLCHAAQSVLRSLHVWQPPWRLRSGATAEADDLARDRLREIRGGVHQDAGTVVLVSDRQPDPHPFGSQGLVTIDREADLHERPIIRAIDLPVPPGRPRCPWFSLT